MKKVIVYFIICTLLCGCYKADDISSLGYLLAVGIDAGEDNKNVYTMQFANPIAFAGKESGESKNSIKSVTVESDSFNNAFEDASAKILKEIDTSYLKLVIFSKEVNVNDTLKMMTKMPRFHPDTYIALSECKANEFLANINSPLEINPAKYYDNIFKNVYNGFSPVVTLKDTTEDCLLLPIVDKYSNCTKVAIANNGTIKKEYNKSYGKIYNILSGGLKDFSYNVKSTGSVVKLSLISNPIFNAVIDDKPYVDVIINLDGEILENSNDCTFETVKKETEIQLKNEVYSFLDSCYIENNCDVLKVFKCFKKHFIINTDFEKFVADTNASEIRFNVQVNTNIKRDGIILKQEEIDI